MRKNECMIQYHLARMPMYGAHESPQYEKANELRENIKSLGKCNQFVCDVRAPVRLSYIAFVRLGRAKSS